MTSFITTYIYLSSIACVQVHDALWGEGCETSLLTEEMVSPVRSLLHWESLWEDLSLTRADIRALLGMKSNCLKIMPEYNLDVLAALLRLPLGFKLSEEMDGDMLTFLNTSPYALAANLILSIEGFPGVPEIPLMEEFKTLSSDLREGTVRATYDPMTLQLTPYLCARARILNTDDWIGLLVSDKFDKRVVLDAICYSNLREKPLYEYVREFAQRTEDLELAASALWTLAAICPTGVELSRDMLAIRKRMPMRVLAGREVEDVRRSQGTLMLHNFYGNVTDMLDRRAGFYKSLQENEDPLPFVKDFLTTFGFADKVFLFYGDAKRTAGIARATQLVDCRRSVLMAFVGGIVASAMIYPLVRFAARRRKPRK